MGVEMLMFGLKLNLAGEINPWADCSLASKFAGMGELSLDITLSAYESFKSCIMLGI